MRKRKKEKVRFVAFGFTLVEVLVVVAILGLLAAVGVPAMMNAHQNAQRRSGDINIVSIEAAIDQWAVINNKRPGDSLAFTNITDYLGGMVKSIEDLSVGDYEMEASEDGSAWSSISNGMWVSGEFRYDWE